MTGSGTLPLIEVCVEGIDGLLAAQAAGADLLAALVRQAAGRIVILGCGALDPANVAAVRDKTGLAEMHFAALKDLPSAMRYRNRQVGMGGTDLDREYRNTVTDTALVAATIAAARA